MSGDHITFARPADSRVSLAKVIHVRGDRIVGKDASPNVAEFDYRGVEVGGIAGLYLAVKEAAGRGEIAIRAKPKGSRGNRRFHVTDNIEPYCAVVPRRWCAFDWDGLPLELQPCANPKWSWEPCPLREPWIGAQIAVRRLPPPFRQASLFWQVSAGAGYNPGFRLRTWHWLDHPVTGDEIKIWVRAAIERKLVDPVTLVEVQPHYLAVKVEGGEDPCPRRFGIIRGAVAEVAVPDFRGIRLRQEAAERAKRPPEDRRPPRDPEQAHAYAQRRIDECLARIKGAGSRHTTYTEEAARARALADRYGLDWGPIKRDLIAAYETTLTPAEARERRSFSTEGMLRWLEARSAP